MEPRKETLRRVSQADEALAEWDKVPRGTPTCVLEPDRVCIRPSGHQGGHSWVSLNIAKLPETDE
jgi:hypothetical protein